MVWCVKTKLQSTKSWRCCIPILHYWIMVYQNMKILHSFCHSIYIFSICKTMKILHFAIYLWLGWWLIFSKMYTNENIVIGAWKNTYYNTCIQNPPNIIIKDQKVCLLIKNEKGFTISRHVSMVTSCLV